MARHKPKSETRFLAERVQSFDVIIAHHQHNLCISPSIANGGAQDNHLRTLKNAALLPAKKIMTEQVQNAKHAKV